jgi:sigma-E factor negative regulatory protein RseC
MKQEDMMHTRGLVAKIEKDGFAQVIMDRKSACSGCDTGKADKCRSCLTGAKIKARVLNSKCAAQGDIVTVSISRAKIMKGAAVFYLLPVILLIAGALIGNSFENSFALGHNLSTMAGGFIGLAAGLYMVRKISEYMNSDQGLVPEITQILSSRSGSTEKLNRS